MVDGWTTTCAGIFDSTPPNVFSRETFRMRFHRVILSRNLNRDSERIPRRLRRGGFNFIYVFDRWPAVAYNNFAFFSGYPTLIDAEFTN
jgi:hypothetical protein